MPTVSNKSLFFKIPVLSIEPNVGLKPNTPQKLEGLIIEPAVCVPNVTGKAPQATAIADPDDEVPAMCFLLLGFTLNFLSI